MQTRLGIVLLCLTGIGAAYLGAISRGVRVGDVRPSVPPAYSTLASSNWS